MPFGVFKTTSFMPVKEKQLKPKQHKNYDSYKPSIVSDSQVTEIHIMLVGRTVGILSDFLCSFKENMTSALHGEGFTFFTIDAFLSLCPISLFVKLKIQSFICAKNHKN